MFLILITLVFLLFGLPLLFAIKSKGWFRFFKYPLGLIFVISLFGIWKTYNPSEDYYLSLFKRISGLELPENTKFLAKKHTEYFVQGEFDSCFVAEINQQTRIHLLKVTTHLDKPVERACGGSRVSKYTRVGNNNSDYPFMGWYLSEDNKVWAYYVRY